jgi:uncharacterized damage-inducible protein DinB
MGLAEELGLMCRWDTWANRQVLGTLRASNGAPVEALAAFQHVLAAELTWVRRIEGAPDGWAELWGEPLLTTCEQWAAEAAAALARLAARDDEAWEATFSYRNSSGREFVDSVARTMLHTLTHSAQYRGEASGFLNHSGHRVPDVDYILWLRTGSPE